MSAKPSAWFGLLLGVVAGCATVKEADLALKEWTSEQFRTKDGKPAADGEASSDAEKDGAKDQDEKTDGAGEGPDGIPASGEEPASDPVPAPQGTSAAAADALFESGHEAMSQGDYETACARFEESNRLEPAVGAVLNLAVCEEKRGRLATAWQLYKRVMSELPPGDDRYPIAQRHASALRPRLPRVTLRLAPNAPKDTSVLYGDVVFGPASFNVPLPMDPGKHELVVRAGAHKERSYDFRLKEGEQKELVIEPGDKN